MSSSIADQGNSTATTALIGCLPVQADSDLVIMPIKERNLQQLRLNPSRSPRLTLPTRLDPSWRRKAWRSRRQASPGLPKRKAYPGAKTIPATSKIGSIALVDRKLGATPTWRANCRNMNSTIMKGGSARDLKVDGCRDKDLDRFMPSQ
uniref:Uncharacterized protein n=1 Tax=Oryza sativa subsp. japonica TaxID=39947 RepID=Q6ZCX4_ORYSJ|nr:hypothetical protein [Oryza sativa Japonica Group]BAC99531.1 hypothetical protein [Oryza sativa Japonica Group]